MVSALPTIFPMKSGQDALFEAAFTLKPSMTSPTRLTSEPTSRRTLLALVTDRLKIP